MRYLSFIKKKIKIYRKALLFFYKKLNFHSRLVFLLKIALPSIIALFVGLLIVIPRFSDDMRDIRIKVPSIDTNSNISFTVDKGSFYGQGDNDAIFSISVDKFKEDRKNMDMTFDKITAKIFLKDASWIDISTDAGNYKKETNQFTMTGNIVLNDSDDNRVFTDEAIIDLKTMGVMGNKKIVAITPFGNIESQGFDFKKNDKYIFTGKVKGSIDTSKIEKSK